MISFRLLDQRYGPGIVGYIPLFLSPDDPRPAAEQFNENYAHGGGWRPFVGFAFNPRDRSITYPGDPKYLPVAEGKLREETILVYPHAWVMVLQADGSHEISRMD